MFATGRMFSGLHTFFGTTTVFANDLVEGALEAVRWERN
jgi:hypothetical protein